MLNKTTKFDLHNWHHCAYLLIALVSIVVHRVLFFCKTSTIWQYIYYLQTEVL